VEICANSARKMAHAFSKNFCFLVIIFKPEMPERKSIKRSKDSDYSLVPNKNLSQKIGFWHWRSGPGDLGQKWVNLLPLFMTSPTKNPKSKTSKFLNILNTRFPISLESLNSSLAQSASKLL